jgi:hypothetical protein
MPEETLSSANQSDRIRSCKFAIQRIDRMQEDVKSLIIELANCEEYNSISTYANMALQLQRDRAMFEGCIQNNGVPTGPKFF